MPFKDKRITHREQELGRPSPLGAAAGKSEAGEQGPRAGVFGALQVLGLTQPPLAQIPGRPPSLWPLSC